MRIRALKSYRAVRLAIAGTVGLAALGGCDFNKRLARQCSRVEIKGLIVEQDAKRIYFKALEPATLATACDNSANAVKPKKGDVFIFNITAEQSNILNTIQPSQPLSLTVKFSRDLQIPDQDMGDGIVERINVEAK